MPSTQKINTMDIVYEAVDANLAGGVLVIPSLTATVSKRQGIKVATDAAKNVLGVTSTAAVTEANRAALENTTDAYGFAGLNQGVPDATVTVWNDAWVYVTYTASAVAFGDKLCAAAAGSVRKWITADGADAIVGWCAEPGGVSAAGGIALARIHV